MTHSHRDPYIHALTFSCYHGHRFLQSDRTRAWLAEAINQACEELHYGLIAYVFMLEHVHLMVQPEANAAPVQRYRQRIKHPVGKKAINHIATHHPDWLERITRQRGKRIERLFWQPGHGYDRLVYSEHEAMRTIEYIHDNPVRRGLATKPSDWKWSSASWYGQRIDGPCRVHGLRARGHRVPWPASCPRPHLISKLSQTTSRGLADS